MGRLARRLLALCSGASLLLCVWVCVTWAMSYASPRSLWKVGNHLDQGSWRVVCIDGRFVARTPRGVSQAENRATPNWSRDWLLFATGDTGPPSPTQPVDGVFIRTRWTSVPCWLPAGVFALLGALAVAAAQRRRSRAARVEANLCPACGYDLRATPARCPECGTLSTR